MKDSLDQLTYLLGKYFRLFLSISFGVFLFILFFQPFPTERFDFNERLVLIAGLGLIVFVFLIFTRIIFPWIIQKYNQSDQEPVFAYFLGGFTLFVITSVAFAFYLYYVAAVELTLYIMFRVALISLVSPVILALYDNYNKLKHENEMLESEKLLLQKQVVNNEKDYLKKNIEIVSESGKEPIYLTIESIAFFLSADNYVEIAYKESGVFKKKLIRNTLKNIEQQIKPYYNFIRCHRTCIVNILYIEKLNRDYYKNWLSIKGHDQQIPVSRQYLMKLKETL